MYVCVCNAVTDSDIRNAVGIGVQNIKQLRQLTGCGTSCGLCEEMAVDLLQQALTSTHEVQNLLPVMQIA